MSFHHLLSEKKLDGIGLATFYHYCPTLCHAISLRYKDYRKFRHKQAIEQGCREVRQLAPVLHAKDKFLSFLKKICNKNGF